MYDILQNSFKTIVNSCKSGEIGSNGYRYREQVANGVQVIIDVKIDDRRNIRGCAGTLSDWRKGNE